MTSNITYIGGDIIFILLVLVHNLDGFEDEKVSLLD